MQAGTGGDEELESSQMGWNELFQQFISRLFTDERDDKQREARAKVGRAIFVDALTSDAKPLQAILSALDAAIAFVRSKYTGDIGTYVQSSARHVYRTAVGLKGALAFSCGVERGCPSRSICQCCRQACQCTSRVLSHAPNSMHYRPSCRLPSPCGWEAS